VRHFSAFDVHVYHPAMSSSPCRNTVACAPPFERHGSLTCSAASQNGQQVALRVRPTSAALCGPILGEHWTALCEIACRVSAGCDCCAGKTVYKPLGAPTEASLLTLGQKAGLDQKQLQTGHPRVASIPFESEHKVHCCSQRGRNWPPVVQARMSFNQLLGPRCSAQLSLPEPKWPYICIMHCTRTWSLQVP